MPLIKLAREKALQQRKFLKEYLRQNDIQGRVMLVDIGWRGTTQHRLTKFCYEEMSESGISIVGCYVGILADNKYKEFWEDAKYGYWFDPSHDEQSGYIIATCRAACELLFMAAEGSAIYYTEETDHIVPKMDLTEYSELDIKKIQTVQSAALEFIDAILNSDIQEMVNPTSKVTMAKFFKFGVRPNRESLNYINGFHYTESGTAYSFKADRFWKYLCKPKKLKKDLINSPWKTGFLRECLGIDLPYYKLLTRLRRIDQRRS